MKKNAGPVAVIVAGILLIGLLSYLFMQVNKPADAGYTISPPALDGDTHALKRQNYLKNHPGAGNGGSAPAAGQ